MTTSVTQISQRYLKPAEKVEARQSQSVAAFIPRLSSLLYLLLSPQKYTASRERKCIYIALSRSTRQWSARDNLPELGRRVLRTP